MNLTLNIEQHIATILDLFYKESRMKTQAARKSIINSCKRTRSLTEQEANTILNKELRPGDKNLFTPHILFYVAGCSLGGLIGILDKYADNFSGKDLLIKQLRGFNDKRNNFIHKLLSSRVNMLMLISRAISTGMNLDKTLGGMWETTVVTGTGSSRLKV
ncbi:MAG: hypothetical protein A3I92_00575 [Candidatus Yanofskybacteria bacterium RIFCSPLOWO2_02_FULL_43_10b]|uniref:Uncharacterized protein n=1 Tax=Candidatus Yanofskybacteria bacterium RIFCSPLOWO2_02_FULL_43_10b TaxID=1802704 RepID=A0A1F8H1G5_9BACT|nr:MAG: hypothetical protein A3I92_00575 [Candidatus Yanofskybacteria bacterium RIFCSPLOWO2_02_FULL_43_10b]